MIATPEFEAFAETRGAQIEGGTPQAFASFIDEELEKWRVVVDEAGVSVE